MAEYRYLQVSNIDDVVVVRFVDSWATTDLAKGILGTELLSLAAHEDCPKLLLNCAGLSYASSAMLGKLIALHNEVKRKGGKLTLCALTPTVQEIFAIMKLEQLFDIRDTESAGLTAMR